MFARANAFRRLAALRATFCGVEWHARDLVLRLREAASKERPCVREREAHHSASSRHVALAAYLRTSRSGVKSGSLLAPAQCIARKTEGNVSPGETKRFASLV